MFNKRVRDKNTEIVNVPFLTQTLTVPSEFCLGVEANNLSKDPGVDIFAGVTDVL